MPFFDNLKLVTKTLIPTLFMATLFIAVVGYGAERLSTISHTTEDIVKGSDPAMLHMARASRRALMIAFDVYRMLSHDGDSQAAIEAHKDFLSIAAQGDNYFDNAIKFAPARAERYRAFKNRFDALIKQAQRPAEIGLQSPVVDHGSNLKAEELDQIAEGVKLMAPIDDEIGSLCNDIAAYNKETEAENTKLADNLINSVQIANWSMVVIAGLSILGGTGFSLWISARAIVGPLKKLGGVMAELARGKLEVNVEGHYNPKTAICDLIAMPPSPVRRIWRPAAA